MKCRKKIEPAWHKETHKEREERDIKRKRRKEKGRERERHTTQVIGERVREVQGRVY